MTWSLKKVLAFWAIFLMGCQTVPVEKVETKPPVQIGMGEDLAPIKFDRVAFRIRRGEPIGSINANILVCSPNSGKLYWNQGRVLTRDMEFSDIFFDELDRIGFDVLGDPTKMFAGAIEGAKKPEYLIGAEVQDVKMNLCEKVNFWTGLPNGLYTGKASIRINWQVYSTFQRKVVYETSTKGYTEITEPTAGEGPLFLNQAFGVATANLAADQAFLELLRTESRMANFVKNTGEAAIEIPGSARFHAPISKQIDQIRPAVVIIRNGLGHGSGFFISPNLIMTNHHVVEGSNHVKIRLITGREFIGEVIRRHAKRDVALVQVEAGGYLSLPIRMEPLKITEEIFAIGAPLDEKNAGTVTKGIVSKFRTNQFGLEDIQSDTDIQGGNSGGALVDGQGNLVGLTYAGIGETSIGINYFIPIYDALKKLNIEIKERGRS